MWIIMVMRIVLKAANDDQTGRNVTRETGCKAIALAYYNVQN